jgi:FkbM family methyltransferase
MKKIYYSILSLCLIAGIVGLISYKSLPETEQQIYLKTFSYVWNRYILQKQFLIAESNYGANFKVKTDDIVGEDIYKHGKYEDLLTKFVINDINYPTNSVILDVGANLGWYSIILDKKITNEVTIYAFEPDELNYQLLVDNLNLNNAKKVTTIKKAISNEIGQKNLYQYPGKNLGKHSLLPINNAKTTLVEATTLDEFVVHQHIDPMQIKLLKVDVEGYEGQVFLKASTVLEHVQYVIHGFAPSAMLDKTITPELLITLLKSKGLSPFIVTEIGLKPVNTKQILEQKDGINLLWMRV